jgi:hypothetical protein
MKRPLFILLGGLVLSVVLGGVAYYWRTAPQRAMLCSDEPELAWLQHEFQLNDAQFDRVRGLHGAYLTDCAAMCLRIAATNALIRAEITAATNVTPELETMLADVAQLRTQCQRQMLEHFFQVSREMPPEQGQRYLTWVREQIFTMPHEQPPSTTPPCAHGH